MKRSLRFKSIFALSSLLLISWQINFGQALLVENFEYPAGTLLTSNGWTAHSGAGTQAITVNSTGLAFTGYPGSNVGLAALLDNTGEDVNKGFSTVTSGTVYFAFLINVTSVYSDYFIHLGGSPIGTTFRGKIFLNGTGSNYNFGLSKGSNTPTLTAGALYTTGTTYLAVLKYNIVAGTTNDEVSLFIFDNAIPSVEPGTPTIGPLADATQADINPGTVALRQANAAQNLVIDGIRVATNWTDAISDIYPPVASFLPANSATDVLTSITPVITFDEPVRKTDGTPLENADLASLITFKLTNSSGTDVPFSAAIDAAKKVITVTPSSSLSNSQAYYLAVGAVEDMVGNESAGAYATFTTISAAAPTITLTAPLGGETYYAGGPASITWTSTNITTVNVDAWVLHADLTEGWEPMGSAAASAGVLNFDVPADASYWTGYKIRVSDAGNVAVNSISGTFTVIPVATSLTDLRTRCKPGDVVKLSSEALVTFIRTNRYQKYIQDAGKGLLIDDAANVLKTALAVGDKITGLEGTLGLYGGVLQLVPTKASVAVASSGNSITPVSMSLADYITNYLNYESMIIRLTDISFNDGNGTNVFAAATNYLITDGTANTITFRTFNADEGNLVGAVIPNYHVLATCIAGFYNSTIQVYGMRTTDFEILTAVEKTFASDMLLYPVPARDFLRVRNISNAKSFEILDATGKLISSSNITKDEVIDIPVSNLKQGIYFLRLTTPEGKVIRKFIK